MATVVEEVRKEIQNLSAIQMKWEVAEKSVIEKCDAERDRLRRKLIAVDAQQESATAQSRIMVKSMSQTIAALQESIATKEVDQPPQDQTDPIA